MTRKTSPTLSHDNKDLAFALSKNCPRILFYLFHPELIGNYQFFFLLDLVEFEVSSLDYTLNFQQNQQIAKHLLI